MKIGEDVLQAAEGNFDQALPITFDMKLGKPGVTTNIYTSPEGNFDIDCVECYVTGSWTVHGHIKVSSPTLLYKFFL